MRRGLAVTTIEVDGVSCDPGARRQLDADRLCAPEAIGQGVLTAVMPRG
jgi:hypothetical protein